MGVRRKICLVGVRDMSGRFDILRHALESPLNVSLC